MLQAPSCLALQSPQLCSDSAATQFNDFFSLLGDAQILKAFKALLLLLTEAQIKHNLSHVGIIHPFDIK